MFLYLIVAEGRTTNGKGQRVNGAMVGEVISVGQVGKATSCFVILFSYLCKPF
jgi:hypothetical protein